MWMMDHRGRWDGSGYYGWGLVAEEIARERYARGEISQAEFETLKKSLGAGFATAG